MSILIKRLFGKDMPMPQEGYVDIRIHFKSGKLRYVTMPIGEYPFYAIFDVEKLPPHGRLGDLDALKAQYKYGEADSEDEKVWMMNIRRAIANAPTVIEAEGEI